MDDPPENSANLNHLCEKSGVPLGWIEKGELLSQLPSCRTSWEDRLKDWRSHKLLRKPKVVRIGNERTVSYYHPDSPERIALILEFLEIERDLDAVRFRMWVYGIGFSFRVLRATFARLVVEPDRKKQEPPPLPASLNEAIEQATEAIGGVRRKLGAWRLPTWLYDRLGSRREADFVMQSLAAKAFGYQIPLAAFNPNTSGTLGEHWNKILGTLFAEGFPQTDESANRITAFIDNEAKSDFLTPTQFERLIREWKKEDFEALQEFLWFAVSNWSYFIRGIEHTFESETARLIDGSFNPTKTDRDAVFFLLAVACICDAMNVSFVDMKPRFEWLMDHVSLHNLKDLMPPR